MSDPTDTPPNSGTINTPELTKTLKVKRRAIKDAKQATGIINTLQNASRTRNIKNARIMAKYDAEKPFVQAELDAEGLGWKSNFTTKPLPRLIDKVAPRFVRAIEGVRYLTNAALPDETPGAAKKTETFRREVTKTIRARAGWKNFISDIAQENALFGYCAVAWLDEFHWMPKFYRQDEFFVPSGTKHDSSSAQLVAFRESFLIHEIFGLIEDVEAAKTAGWDVPAVVEAINNALPKDRRSDRAGWERVHEDLIREACVGVSHESGPLSITVWHILAQEVTGKVSHYIFLDGSENASTKAMETLFEREDQFDSMHQATRFYAFQHGNGKLHGSKGIGREIYSMAAMVDRARNEVADRLNLSGKLVIQCDEKALKRFKVSVVGPALLIGQGYNISERKIETSVEEFLQLDQFLTSLLDEMAGATTPKVFEGERVTKAQVDLFASREEESRDNIISRFLNQFADMMSTLQRRICDPDTDEEDAKQLQKKLLQVMSREEIDTLSKQPVAETVEDFTEIQRQAIVIAAAEAKGNPLYNQREMERRKLTAQLDEEFADAVLLPEEDPTETAEQTRLQQLELLLIGQQATDVPISPRDNDVVHLQILMPALEAAGTESAQNPGGVEVLNAMLAHAEKHFEQATNKGVNKELLAQVGTVLQQLRSQMEQLNAIAAQETQLQQTGQLPAPGAEAAQPPP